MPKKFLPAFPPPVLKHHPAAAGIAVETTPPVEVRRLRRGFDHRRGQCDQDDDEADSRDEFLHLNSSQGKEFP